VLRDFEPRDHEPVRELVLAGMRERWGDAYDPSANPDLDNISACYVDRGADVVVAEIGGEIVATGILWPEAHDLGGSSASPSIRPIASGGSVDRSSRS
jgi:hypothetical protein